MTVIRTTCMTIVYLHHSIERDRGFPPGDDGHPNVCELDEHLPWDFCADGLRGNPTGPPEE